MGVHMRKLLIWLTVFSLCVSLAACGADHIQRDDEQVKPTVTTAPTEESDDAPTKPTESIPTQPTQPTPTEPQPTQPTQPKPTEPKPTEPTQPMQPTLPEEGQDPGGFGPIF